MAPNSPPLTRRSARQQNVVVPDDIIHQDIPRNRTRRQPPIIQPVDYPIPSVGEDDERSNVSTLTPGQ